MKIYRSRPGSHFTQIPDGTLRDERLSYAARGLLAEILSRPDDWTTSADDIWRRARQERDDQGEGRDTVRGLFAELEAAGYLKRVRINGGRGRITTELHFYDVPAGRTEDDTARRRRDLCEDASPQVAPTTGIQASADQAPVSPSSAPTGQTRVSAGRTDDGVTGVGRPGVFTNTDYEQRSLSETLERIVLGATDASPDEAREIVKVITDKQKPGNPLPYLRAVAKRGDLSVWLQELRDSRTQFPAGEDATVASLRRGPECEHGFPGGASPHPTSGKPLCPLCRTAAVRRPA